MSLMQLLAVGQSVRAVKDRPSPYRMRQQSLLPRFGPAGLSGQGPPVSGPGISPSPDGPCDVGRGVGSAHQLGLGTAPGPAQQPAPAAAAAPAQPYPAGRWLTKPWGRVNRVGGPQAAQGPVQGELSLETVRPVRNDLTDSDVEVVPAARPSSGAPEPVHRKPEPCAHAAPARTPLWTWLRARLLQRID